MVRVQRRTRPDASVTLCSPERSCELLHADGEDVVMRSSSDSSDASATANALARLMPVSRGQREGAARGMQGTDANSNTARRKELRRANDEI
jgi:hypothetical protein